MSLDVSPAEQLRFYRRCMAAALQRARWLKLLSGRTKTGVAGVIRTCLHRWMPRFRSRRQTGTGALVGTTSVLSCHPQREDLAGKGQMIYIDPPYGIKFASNFQPEVGKRDVKDKESDLTREPEMVKAFRDTWHLGVHSYLSYLRDRISESDPRAAGADAG